MAPRAAVEPGADPAPESDPAPGPALVAPPGGRAPAAVSVPSMWQETVPAVGTAAWLVRERLAAWLTALRWPALVVEDVVLAVSEAVSNCNEHAYPPGCLDPVIDVSAAIEAVPGPPFGPTGTDMATGREPSTTSNPELPPGRRLRIRIRDHGTWRPVPPEPGHRGRGLQMMMALMDDVVIHHSGTDGRRGTEVILVSPTVVPEPPP